MKIDKEFMLNNSQAELVEKESTGLSVVESKAEPVQLQKSPLPKTDSVEVKTNSFYNFENVAKLDPAQTNLNAKDVPAALIPGVPFREKVELPKTLPNGSSVESGVGSGDLGFGKTNTGPNHMGIDLKAGGIDIRNQLNDALKLREGSQDVQNSTAPSGTVNYHGIGGQGKTEATYSPGFERPGMGLISADKDPKGGPVIPIEPPLAGPNPVTTLLNLPKIVEEVTGRAADFMDGIKALLDPNKRLKAIEDAANDKYVNPDAPEGTQGPVVTQELLDKVKLRFESNTRPATSDDSAGVIDGRVLSGTDPRRALISNPLPEDQSVTGTGESIQVILDAKGPDVINDDPVIGGGGEPIVIDPNRPK